MQLAPTVRLPGAAKPRVLFLSCHLPWPAISGGRRRELELIRRLAHSFDIHLLVVSKTFAEDQRHAAVLGRRCRRVEVFPAAPGEPAGAEDEKAGEPWQVRRHRCPTASERVGELLAQQAVDLIHVEGYYLMQHVPAWAPVPVLLVEQNVEYELERQRLAASPPAARGNARRRYQLARAQEIASWSRADAVAAVTPEDRELIRAALGGCGPRLMGLIPDGGDHLSPPRPAAPARGPQRSGAPVVAFLANFGYSPNVDAAMYLCQEILPLIRRQVPDVQLWLVGNDPPPEVSGLSGQAIHVTGRVPDVAPYLDAADVAVCPLRIGGGIKVKAIEALRRGKALVSTSIGTQGLPDDARSAVVVADDHRAFAAAVATLLLHPERRAEVEQRAARAAMRLPTWAQAAAALKDIYAGLLRERAAAFRDTTAGVLAGVSE